MRNIKFGLMLLIVISTHGCAHKHLRMRTVAQSNTLNDIFEKQVLDNLAKFVAEPDSVPSFAFPKEGNTNVTDNITATGTPFEAFSAKAGINGTRGGLEAWGLQPITDPDKLLLMRCAYQRAVGCVSLDPCVDCCEREKKFAGKPDRLVAVSFKNDKKELEAVIDPLTGEPYVDPETGFRATYDNGRPVLNPKTGLPKLYIKIPTYNCDGQCAGSSGWLCHGTFAEVPKNHRQLIGNWNGEYVWVKPGQYDSFAKLVLRILDIAVNDPPATVATKKEVKYFIGANGKPTTEKLAVGTVSATINVGVSNEAILAEKLTVNEVTEMMTQQKIAQKKIKEMFNSMNLAPQLQTNILNALNRGNSEKLNEFLPDDATSVNEIKSLYNNAEQIQFKPQPIAPSVLPKQKTFAPSFGPSTLQEQRRLDAIRGGF